MATLIGEYLRTRREARGLSQADVSLYLGLTSPQYVSNVERGNCGPSGKRLKKWAGFIDADMTECVELMVDDYQSRLIEEVGV